MLNQECVETLLRPLPAIGSREASGMSTLELREHFLATDLFEDGNLRLYYAEQDRMIIGGIRAQRPVSLPRLQQLGTRFFLERRELGVINIGAPGVIRADNQEFQLDRLDGLYIGMGCEEVEFAPSGDGVPEFYLLSCPAHRAYPATLVRAVESICTNLGDAAHSSCRTIRKYICPETVPSCQLTMGITSLASNSVWNTWPAHTHGRRCEVYLYFDAGDGMVVHLMGRPGETRHIIVRDRQAVYSPAWSIHSGAGTNNYSFIWGMAGENQDFSDLDLVAPGDLA